MKKFSVLFIIWSLAVSLFPLYNTLKNLSGDSLVSLTSQSGFMKDKLEVFVYDIDFIPLKNARVENEQGVFYTDIKGKVELPRSFTRVVIEKSGYQKLIYTKEQVLANDGNFILLKDNSRKAVLNLKKDKDVTPAEASLSYVAGTGGVELPDGETLGEGKGGVATAFGIDDRKKLASNEYHTQSSIVYGLTDRVDVGFNYNSLQSTDSQDGNSDIKAFFKYKVGSYDVDGKKVNVAVGTSTDQIRRNNLFAVVGVKGDKGELNFVAQKDRDTGANNYGVMYKKEVSPLLYSPSIKKSYVLLEMKQNSNDKLSLINAGYRVQLKNNWNLDLIFKRDRETGARSTALGGSIVF
jgi:hypothetical protein